MKNRDVIGAVWRTKDYKTGSDSDVSLRGGKCADERRHFSLPSLATPGCGAAHAPQLSGSHERRKTRRSAVFSNAPFPARLFLSVSVFGEEDGRERRRSFILPPLVTTLLAVLAPAASEGVTGGGRRPGRLLHRPSSSLSLSLFLCMSVRRTRDLEKTLLFFLRSWLRARC